ncbi:endonuclease NucS domain-containing protein [Sulfuricurvum sp.]|uniref:endonuclease NucS domain-containing protein n=1 Tax=Sulfuricurvum sp. TaxID=2025608 RepID=UPI003C4EC82F
MERIEASIRDYLVTTLDVLEKGLEYVEKEKYLPNDVGTRGFVDILAKDKDGRWVLIELKRSEAASREALHEVLKYIEAFKKDRSVREHEIRVMVVSTEWRELIVPFSSFVTRTTCNVEGIKLSVDGSYRPIHASSVDPLPAHSGRIFAPWHELALYTDEDSAKKGLESYEHACKEKGILDFVIVDMAPHPSHRDRELNAMVAAYESMGMYDQADRERIAKQLPTFDSLLYFVPLLQTEAFCQAVVRKHAEQDDLAEFLEYISDMDAKEKLCELHEKVYEVGPDIHRDHFEIAYPAKFGSKLLDDEGWTIRKIHRYGGVAANELLDDAIIISEVRGNDGVTGQKYSRSLSVQNKAELASVREEIRENFADNVQLSQQMMFCLDDAIRVPYAERLDIHIYNPSHITLSIYMEVVEDNSGAYVPNAHIVVLDNDGSPLQFFYVALESNGQSPSVTHILDVFYAGNPELLTASLSWGGFDRKDAEVCKEIGLSYVVYRSQGEPNVGHRLDNFRWIECEISHPLEGFFGFIQSNSDFVEDIVQLYSSTWNGFMVMWDDTKRKQLTFKT